MLRTFCFVGSDSNQQFLYKRTKYEGQITKIKTLPTIFTHTVSAVALGHLIPARQWPRRFWILSAVCAMLPDADVIAFSFGIPYGHMLGHRGLTHSLAFAVVLGLVVVVLAFRGVPRFSKAWWGLVLYFSVVTASHGVLDALTDGGRGVAFFAPFDNARHFFPWQPLRVSPIGAVRFFTARGLETLLSEMKWVWIPSALCIVAGQVFKRRPTKHGSV